MRVKIGRTLKLTCSGYGCDDDIVTPGMEYIEYSGKYYHEHCWSRFLETLNAITIEGFYKKLKRHGK